MTGQRDTGKSFDPAALPIHDTRLIEASAGTGKTYNIANLYLLLVLGMGQDNPHQPLAVDRILVVTFTRAAAAELRGRIRGLLEQAWQDFRAGRSEHDFIQELIAVSSKEDREDRIRLLYRALLRIDEAQISTIHGYAMEVARRYLFEAGTLADLEVEVGSGARQERLLKDLYRQLLSGALGLPENCLEVLDLSREEDFRRYFARVTPRSRILPAEFAFAAGTDPKKLLERYIDNRTRQVEQDWSELAQAWADLESHAGGPENLENELGNLLDPIEIEGEKRKIKAGPAVRKALQKALEGNALDAVSIDTGKPWGHSKPIQRLRKFHRATDTGSASRFAVAFRAFLQAYEAFTDARPNLKEIQRNGLRALLAGLAQRALGAVDLAELNLDELIILINRRLATDDSLRRQLLQAWPVCLVDEFQDTDPEQMDLFNGIYRPSEDDEIHGLFMIGDPKQSIYEFRGADIFNYLNTRRSVEERQLAQGSQAIFSLDENFRSKRDLVEITNSLFADKRNVGLPEHLFVDKRIDSDGTFLFEGIEYRPVRSSEERGGKFDHGTLRLLGQPAKPLVLIGNSDPHGKHSAESLRLLYARDTAQRIASLLRNGAVIENGGIGQALKPADVAVLVRSGTEARKIREQLTLLGLRSVYLSQKDSVFENATVAGDLYHALAAMNEPDDRRRLRAALATPLLRGFAFDFSEVKALGEDESALERCIEEFGAYRETWRRHGILTALNQLLARHEGRLLESLATRPDSDRLLTDLRHLADLLQQQDAECDSPEQLLDWYAARLEDDSDLDEDRKRIRLESDEDLVRILTIHVAKGLEFPVVFLPFTFMGRPLDSTKNLPVYRREKDGAWEPLIDFEGDTADIRARMDRERLAEDMRLLYVGVTRAIHQCQLGLSAMYYGRTDQPMFRHTPWAHLLRDQLDPDAAAGMPSWDELRSALQAKLAGVGHAVDYRVIGDAGAPDGASQETPEATPDPEPREPEEVTVRPSTWRVTSYSRLAHGHGIVLAERTDDDRERFADPAQAVAPEPPPESPTDGDQRWAQDIRYTLRGGVQTGNCLHDILEERALGPDRDLRAIIERQLPMRGLERPFRPRELDDAEYRHRVERYLPDLTNWLQSALEQPLGTAAGVPRLDTLLRPGRALPEMRFDFRLGREGEDAHYGAVDRVLEAHGHSTLLRRDSVSGLMTGAIDLLFIHEDRLYLADYKSNRLGAAPHFYDRPHLDAAMREQRYDLQYLIYTVAVDRHFRRRLGSRWAFDGGELSFGGVFYLFLRGMGLPGAYQDHGVWFARPEAKLVHALDSALGGEAWS